MPPRAAIAPICSLTSDWTSLNRDGEGIADPGCEGVERVMKAKGSWPFRASGMPTTQHSATMGCEEMACSMEPVEKRWAALRRRGCKLYFLDESGGG